MLFAPRIGIEFLYHIRLMAQFNICRKGYNNFSLTVGFVLGGKPKNNEYISKTIIVDTLPVMH